MNREVFRSDVPLGIYIHIPFCVRKCPYCDFVSGPSSGEERADYLAALRSEIRSCASAGRAARSVYLGGGTPSELAPGELGPLIQTVRESFPVNRDAEVSMECNPGTLTAEKLTAMKHLGFTRLSLGVQSFSDRFLRVLGRIHCAEEGRDAYLSMRRAGFDNVNLDLIFAIPGQTLEDWERDLSEALALGPDHLSLYNLSVEPETEFGRLRDRGLLNEVDDDLAAAMYELALDMSEAAGYEQYEISNFARPGKRCLHNLVYWHNEEYRGFGVSAASYLDGIRWTHTADRLNYVTGVRAGRVSRSTEEKLEKRAALGEEIMLRLRLNDGLPVDFMNRRYGIDLQTLYRDTLDLLLSEELLACREGTLRLTRRGRLVANEVCRRFL